LIYLGFITEGKLAAVLIKPSLGVSNWPVIYIINYTPTVFWHHSAPRHQVPNERKYKSDPSKKCNIMISRNAWEHHALGLRVAYLLGYSCIMVILESAVWYFKLYMAYHDL
jgi:hypothetical protein